MVGFVTGSLGGATVESCDCIMRASVTGISSCDPAMYSNSSHDLVIRSCDGRGESAVSGSSRLKQSGMTTTNSSSEPDASLSVSISPAEKEVHVPDFYRLSKLLFFYNPLFLLPSKFIFLYFKLNISILLFFHCVSSIYTS